MAVDITNGTITFSSSSNSTLRFEHNFSLDNLTVDAYSTNISNITLSLNRLKVSSINSSYPGKLNVFNLNSKMIFFSNGTKYSASGDQNLLISILGFVTISDYPYYVNTEIYNTSTYETSREYFTLNVSYDNYVYSAVSATLFYNGSSYSTVKSYSGDTAYFVTSLDIPLISSTQNKEFYWQIGLTNSTGTFYFNTTKNNQTVYNITLKLCDPDPVNVTFINFTFVDETTGLPLNGSFVSGTFDYYLGAGSVYKELIFTNVTANPNYAFCFSPSSRDINIQYSVAYSSTGYQTRVVNPTADSYSSSGSSKTLYLLGTNDGLYVTFQMVNIAGQVIADVDVVCNRLIGSELQTVAFGASGDDGILTLFLNPFFSHTCTFSKSGYDPYSTSFFPTQSSYTITLSSQNYSSQLDDYSKGITYKVYPANNTLVNNTLYSFNFTVSSSVYELDSFGFVLSNATGVLDSTSSGANGGSLAIPFNTGNNTLMVMNYYWVINDTYINGTRTWVVENDGNTDWSIRYLFTDLTRFLGTGIFGLDSFGLYIIVYLFIFIVVGIMSFKFGVTSPGAISVLVFGLVFTFDVTLGILPNIGNTHFITIFTAIIMIGMVIREWTR